MFLKKANVSMLLLVALLSFGCSGSDSGTNTDLTTGDAVAPGEITIPATLKAAADGGDEGAQAVVTLIEGIDNLDSLSTLLDPPAQAAMVGAPSFAPAADSTWEWTESGVTYTLAYTETATEYQWELVADGSDGVVSYNNFVVAELSEAKDGSSGNFAVHVRSIAGFAFSYDWTVSGGTLTMTLTMGTSAYYVQVVATIESDGSGEIMVYDGAELKAKVIWDGNGHGQWWNYSDTGEGTF